jgi:WD40 repeat protein
MVTDVAFSHDGRRLATASLDGSVRLWDATRGAEVLTITGQLGEVHCVAFGPDGQRLVITGVDKRMQRSIMGAWDAATGQQLFEIGDGRQLHACFRPDGKLIAAGGFGDNPNHRTTGVVQVWDLDPCRDRVSLQGQTVIDGWVSPSPDGKRLAGGNRDGTVRVWDAATGQEALTWKGHTSGVTCVCFSPDGARLASANLDKTVQVWNAETGEEVLTLKGHTGVVFGLCFSPDGRRLASAAADGDYNEHKPGEVKVWDTASGQEVLSLKGHPTRVTSVCFSPDGTRIASASPTPGRTQGSPHIWDRSEVRIWDAATGKELLSLKGSYEKHGQLDISSVQVCFSPDGRLLAMAARGATDTNHPAEVQVWDTESGRVMYTLASLTSIVSDVCFSPDGSRLAGIGHDGMVRVWDAATGQEALTWKGHTSLQLPIAPGSIWFSPDGKRLFSLSGGNTVTVRHGSVGQEVLSLRGHSRAVNAVAFSPDGRRIASAALDWANPEKVGEVRIWDAATGRPVRTFHGHAGGVGHVGFSPDGRRLATASHDGTAKLWDVETGQELRTFRGEHTYGVTSVSFSPDGKRLLLGIYDKTLKVHDAETGEELLTLRDLAYGVITACFSPDGKRIAAGSVQGQGVRVWDAETGREVITPRGKVAVWSACFSPDGRRLAVSEKGWTESRRVRDPKTGQEEDATAYISGHDVLRVWNLETEREVFTARIYNNAKVQREAPSMSCLVLDYSPDGNRIVTGGRDGVVRIWDAHTGREQLTLKGHLKAVHRVAFSPDGRRVASASHDGMVKVWDVAMVERNP